MKEKINITQQTSTEKYYAKYGLPEHFPKKAAMNNYVLMQKTLERIFFLA